MYRNVNRFPHTAPLFPLNRSQTQAKWTWYDAGRRPVLTQLPSQGHTNTARWPCYSALRISSGTQNLVYPETMSSSRIPCTYERQVYIIMSPLYWAMVVIICVVILWPAHAINLCCSIVGSSYTMTAKHKSNIGWASFTCVVVDLLLCKTIH